MRERPDGPLQEEPSGDPRACTPVLEVAALALRLGLTAFGGPAAHIAMLEEEVVRRRGWLSRERFLDLLGATNLIPGPSSTEMVIHVGRERAGIAGLWIAGACFIAPAALITLAAAWAYVRYGTLPAGQGVLFGAKPAVVAILVLAIGKLARTAAKNIPLVLLGPLVVALYLAGLSEVLLLIGSGVVGMGIARTRPPKAASAALLALLLPAVAPRPLAALVVPAVAAAATAAPSAGAIGLYFLKIGSVLFGSGYVLLAFLQQGQVEHYGWLTRQQLLDAVAVGQFTPGPLFCTATFVGYLLAGLPGAAAATLGIFLPSFVLVWITHPVVARLRASPLAGGFLDGVNAGAVALMAAVAGELGHAALRSWPAAAIAALALLLLLRTRLNSAWIVLGGALLGLVLRGL
jgi:chromate transporter